MEKKLYNTRSRAARNIIKKANILIGSGKPVVTLLTYYRLCLEFSIDEVEYLLRNGPTGALEE